MEKTEIVVGDFMARHIDPMNWQVFERREIKGTSKRKGEIDWVALPNFYGSLKLALVKMRDLARERKMPRGDLETAIAAIEVADENFLKELKKAVG